MIFGSDIFLFVWILIGCYICLWDLCIWHVWIQARVLPMLVGSSTTEIRTFLKSTTLKSEAIRQEWRKEMV